MKKLKVLSMAVATVGMFSLTSCLGDGGNIRQGSAYGLIDAMTEAGYQNVAYTDDITAVYSPKFATLQSNQCVAFSYVIDYSSEANTSGKKYITAEVGEVVKINQIETRPYLSDTSKINKNELTITTAVLDWNLIKGRAFIGTTHPAISTDQSTEYEMSYDVQNPSKVAGENVYDLIIRATKLKDGTAVEGQKGVVNAYNISRFLTESSYAEKSNGKTTVKFRFMYMSAFNKDTTSATWSTSDKTYEYTIPTSSSN